MELAKEKLNIEALKCSVALRETTDLCSLSGFCIGEGKGVWMDLLTFQLPKWQTLGVNCDWETLEFFWYMTLKLWKGLVAALKKCWEESGLAAKQNNVCMTELPKLEWEWLQCVHVHLMLQLLNNCRAAFKNTYLCRTAGKQVVLYRSCK